MLKVFASTVGDAQQGWVWLESPSLPPRSIVKITNADSGSSIYCEALRIDGNFLQHYNKPPRVSITSPATSIVMNGWYRSKLGNLAKQSSAQIKVELANSHWGRFMACTHHPQVVVRVAAWLGLISVVLGAIGVFLGVLSLRGTCA
ncbi:hypothetical protein [Tahibacter aquaticus]|uniref:hypothetical protein n=1 Tax=Tahibacter aquaticus TaxID=520092 RepID=UPI00105E3D9E|nr:hypothetical protein [Tahibacter aquaticus]